MYTSIYLLVLASTAYLSTAVPATERCRHKSALAEVPGISFQQNVLIPSAGISTEPSCPSEVRVETTNSSPPETGPLKELNTPESPIVPPLPWLVTSPYTTQPHLTNLSTLPLPSQLLTLALTHLTSTNSSYATIPYQHAFNWPTVFHQLKSIAASHNHTWKSTIFYVVEFRSRLKTGIDRELLFKLDRESHREATESGGLLKYWFGSTSDDAEGRNLATCLWVKKEDAVAGGKGTWHRQARGVIPRMYESIEVKGLKLTVEDDVGGWKFEPWSEG